MSVFVHRYIKKLNNNVKRNSLQVTEDILTCDYIGGQLEVSPEF